MRQKKSLLPEFKLFTVLFLALNLVFLFYQTTFFWGNHDWDWIKGTDQLLALNTGMFEARFSKFVLNVFLFGGHILPLLNNLIAFAFLSLGAVFTVRYWQIKSLHTALLTALAFLLAPFILGWLYFPINILGNFAAVFLVAGGLLLDETHKPLNRAAAVLCFIAALGVYPSVMEMMIILILFKHILSQTAQFKAIFQSFIIPLTALILFKILLLILGHFELIAADYYNLQTISLTQFFARFPEMFKLAVKQLILPLPFMNENLKCVTLIIVLTAFLSLQRISHAFLFAAAFLTTVLSSWLTVSISDTAFMPRVNFYGLNFFIAGAIAVLLANIGFKRNIGLVLGVLFVWQSVIADIYAEKVWAFGKTAEENLTVRLISEVEKANPPKALVPVVAGELSLRPRYYQESYFKESPYLLNRSFMVRHIPSGIFNFYTPEALFAKTSVISTMTPELYQFLATADKPYPHSSAVFIDDDYAIMLLTKEGIEAIQAQLPR